MQKKKIIILIISILILTLISGGIFYYLKKPKLTELEKQGEIGDYILNNDFSKKPIIPIQQQENNYQLTDSLTNGPTIQYANPPEELKDQPKNEQNPSVATDRLNIEFPKNYPEPINIKLDEQRVITIKDNTSTKYKTELITEDLPLLINNEKLRINNEEFPEQEPLNPEPENIDQQLNPEQLEQGNDRTLEQSQQLEHLQQSQHTSYLKYQSKDKRISTYYAYQKANNQRTLKHWTIYTKPNKNQEEKEEYQINNAKLKLNNQGEVEVYYFGEQDLKNEEVKAQVDSNLMARAQRTLQKELGEDILNTNNHTPDFIIPAPYYITKNQERKTLIWELNQDSNTISLNFKPQKDEYPIGLDPTIQFTVPGQESSSDTITIIPSNSVVGSTLGSGDLNDDGRTDLIVGSTGFNLNTGRVYIFYNDGSISSSISGADQMITGEGTGNYFGTDFLIADMNNDGVNDLIINSCEQYYASADKVYIFYSDGNYPQEAYLADKIITGEVSGNFGSSLSIGDLNNDGNNDLVVSDESYNSFIGRTYVFYNDGDIPINSIDADAAIDGVSVYDHFGACLGIEDFNSDGVKDLIISAASEYSTNNGKIFIFYSDGSYPANYSGADLFIDSSVKHFGTKFLMGDFNNDGKRDIAAYHTDYTTTSLYIFYNDGTLPAIATSRDVGIAGDATCSISPYYMSLGDYDNSGTLDIASGCYGYTSYTGRVQIFYNDGSFPATTASADLNITGETTNNYFGYALESGDFNYDGRIDLAVGAYFYGSQTGRVYIFNNDGSIPTGAASSDIKITGESKDENFGNSYEFIDFNNDGKKDLVIGSNSNVYIFYNDGDFPSDGTGADLKISGDPGIYFGTSLSGADFNNDGKIDLVVGASAYSSNTGRAYIFYNDGSISSTSSGADITITGQGSGNVFGVELATEDMNRDGKKDLIVGASGYSSSAGRVYVFYNDGSIPTTAATADVIITGESGSYFGRAMEIGDMTGDGVVDLVVGAEGYSSWTGRSYIFYGDGSIPTTAVTADLIISGEGSSDDFGTSFAIGDFNGDGKSDLAVGAPEYNGDIGRAYIFYSDGSIPNNATNADVIIEGELTNDYFGNSMTSLDYNNDGKKDIVICATGDNQNGNKAHVFYNDGSYVSNAEESDVIIRGEYEMDDAFGDFVYSGDINLDGKDDLIINESHGGLGKIYIIYSQQGQILTPELIGDDNYLNKLFGYTIASGDFNDDGNTDLVASSVSYNSSSGRIYIFYNDGSIPTYADTADVIIDGGAISDLFGASLAGVDIDYDGDDDLIVGAYGYSTNTGRTYIFYNDGSYPSGAGSADVIITGSTTNTYFGATLTIGDLNYDSRIDLVVGATSPYNGITGVVYIFNNDGSIPTTAGTADKIITGESGSEFGASLTVGDFNYDSRVDLAVGAFRYSSYTGRAYIFYNDGNIPTSASSADVIIAGEVSNSYFGSAVSGGDFNNDGRVDLAVGAKSYSSSKGRVYIFNNDGSIPTAAASADVIITKDGGDFNCYFGDKLLSGDFDADGDDDLVVGAFFYPNNGSQGIVYIFYNDGSYPANASEADISYTGLQSSNQFGWTLAKGDFNNDTRTDLAVGAYGYPSGNLSGAGQVYIFYNDGFYPATAEEADLKIVGNVTGNYFGATLASGDFNADGETDLAVGAYQEYAGRGKVYLFYNDGDLPNSSSGADVNIIGENIEDNFASSITVGDLNYDGREDLIVGAKNYSLSTGRVYIFYNDGAYPSIAGSADNIITGEGVDNYFGTAFETGDFNDDGRSDLAVGATGCNNNTGRVYIFYNDGSIPALASGADNIITGEGVDNYFGYSLTGGDLNYDNKTDLISGSYGYNANTGRVYIFNNDGSIPALASGADNIITGEGVDNYFGYSMATGDLNADSRVDLVVGAIGYATGYTGRLYVFYNDGSISNFASGADILMSGDSVGNYFSNSLVVGDFNLDGKDDLAVGAYRFYFNEGRAYIFYNKNGISSSVGDADAVITGASGNYLGSAMVSGDFDGNNKIDLGVGLTVNSYYGSFYIYTTDAPGTKPDYIESSGMVQFEGSGFIE